MSDSIDPCDHTAEALLSLAAESATAMALQAQADMRAGRLPLNSVVVVWILPIWGDVPGVALWSPVEVMN